MHRGKLHLSTWLLAILLAVLVSFSGMMCLVEAFSLGCRRAELLAACGAAAILATCAMMPRRRWPIILTALLLWFGLGFWQRAALWQGMQALIFAVTTEYAQVFEGVAVTGQAGDCLRLLVFLAMPMAWITAWTVCREGNALLLVLICLPVFLLCLIIVDLAPVLWLVVLCFSLLLLLLTHGVREHSASEGSRLGWWLLLPTVILVTAITVIWPPADYVRADWSEELRAAVEDGISLETLQKQAVQTFTSPTRWSRELRQVDLSTLGPKSMTGRKVLESLSVQQRYYLRGLSLGVYEDNCWSAVEQATYAAAGFVSQPLTAVSGSGTKLSLQLRTERTEELLYTTYVLGAVPEGTIFIDDAYAKNEMQLQTYQVDYFAAGSGTGTVPAGYDDYVNRIYTQLPQTLRQELEAFLSEMGWDLSASPEKLAEYVKNLGVYDLNTPRLPHGEDFVLYFLRESHRGYCVHFATATAALLRTMGVPARYVTGYLVSGEPGTWVTVTEDDAHAWVEYYVSGVGWVPLEATPAASQEETPASPAPEQPVETTPEPEMPQQQPEATAPDHEMPETKPAATMAEKKEPAAAWMWLLAVPAALVLVVLRYQLGLRRRKKRCCRGNPNRRTMAYWRWLVLLARQEGASVEEELICLAEKARFSQHAITEEELITMQQAVDARIQRLKQRPMGRQLWFRFGLILY